MFDINGNFNKLFEGIKGEEKRVNEKNTNLIKKLIPLVRKVLKTDFAGNTLSSVTEEVAEWLASDSPDILEDEEYGPSNKDVWEEFVWDIAGRLGY